MNKIHQLDTKHSLYIKTINLEIEPKYILHCSNVYTSLYRTCIYLKLLSSMTYSHSTIVLVVVYTMYSIHWAKCLHDINCPTETYRPTSVFNCYNCRQAFHYVASTGQSLTIQ